MTTNEIKSASMNALIARSDKLLAHPEHDYRIRDELHAIDEALMSIDLYAKVDAEVALDGWAA